MAFAAYSSTQLETQQLPGATSTFNPLLALTRGIGAVLPASAAGGAAGAATATKGKLRVPSVWLFRLLLRACAHKYPRTAMHPYRHYDPPLQARQRPPQSRS
jgi:hypothetical protein